MTTSFQSFSEETRELALLAEPTPPHSAPPAAKPERCERTRWRVAAAVLLGLLGGLAALLLVL